MYQPRTSTNCRARVAVLAIALATLGVLMPSPSASSVREEIVSFETHDGLTLEGIVSYPSRGDGPFPALLLIHGRGVRDADFTAEHPLLTRGRQKIFRSIARFFSSRGYAVLRYNKRGASFDRLDDQPELLWESTFSDLVEDARGALATLLAHPRAAAAPVVVLGLSEGTAVGARLARGANVDLLILVGSLNDVGAVIQYQFVDRYVTFFREAADGDQDGFVTLEELDRLDGKTGLDSFFVYDTREALFDLTELPDGTLEVHGFGASLDTDGDGRLEVEGEIRAGFERALEDLFARSDAGELGSFDPSFVRLKDTTRLLRGIRSAILLAHGDLDVWNPPSEALAIVDKLEGLGRSDYRLLRFRRLGHSLSRSREYFREDGGLTIHDNPTLNAPTRRSLRRLLKAIGELVPELGR